jgi:hypothetical protein
MEFEGDAARGSYREQRYLFSGLSPIRSANNFTRAEAGCYLGLFSAVIKQQTPRNAENGPSGKCEALLSTHLGCG